MLPLSSKTRLYQNLPLQILLWVPASSLNLHPGRKGTQPPSKSTSQQSKAARSARSFSIFSFTESTFGFSSLSFGFGACACSDGGRTSGAELLREVAGLTLGDSPPGLRCCWTCATDTNMRPCQCAADRLPCCLLLALDHYIPSTVHLTRSMHLTHTYTRVIKHKHTSLQSR